MTQFLRQEADSWIFCSLIHCFKVIPFTKIFYINLAAKWTQKQAICSTLLCLTVPNCLQGNVGMVLTSLRARHRTGSSIGLFYIGELFQTRSSILQRACHQTLIYNTSFFLCFYYVYMVQTSFRSRDVVLLGLCSIPIILH